MRTGLRLAPLVAVLQAAVVTHGAAQAALSTDLWRVAAGTLVVPAAIATDASAALWTPAFAVPDGPGLGLRLGVESIHAPADAGVSGAVASAAVRILGELTVNAVYGRLWLGDLVRTESSPEAIGTIPAYAEVVSLGVARRSPGRPLTVGAALRVLTGRLDYESATRLAGDVGIEYAGPHLRLGAATHFLDPAAAREQGTACAGAAEYRTSRVLLWGSPAFLSVRYGLTWSRGDGAAHLVSAGLALGEAFELDAGAANERAAAEALWRSRVGAAILVGAYRVYLARDGGVNGFGATYRFGMAATVR